MPSQTNRRFEWEAAIRKSELAPMVTLVALTMATRMNPKGETTVGSERVSRECRLAQRTVQRHRKTLFDDGWLVVRPTGPKTYLARVPTDADRVSTDAESVSTDVFKGVSTDAITGHRYEQAREQTKEQRGIEVEVDAFLDAASAEKGSLEGVLKDVAAVYADTNLQSETSLALPPLTHDHPGGTRPRSDYPNLSKVVDADGGFVDERVIENEAEEVSLIEAGFVVYRIRSLEPAVT
jgi:hypothetical protein